LKTVCLHKKGVWKYLLSVNPWLCACLFAVISMAGSGACFGQSITDVSSAHTPTGWQIQVLLSDSLGKGPGTCKIVDLARTRDLNLESCSTSVIGNVVAIQVAPSEPMTSDVPYLVALSNLDFTDPARHVEVLVKLVKVPKSVAPESEKSPTGSETGHSSVSNSPCLLSRFGQIARAKLGSASGRDDSNLYFSGQITHSSGQDFEGSYDVKADLSGRCLIANTVHLIGPVLDLKGGSDPNTTPDSLNFALQWEFPLVSPREAPISSIRLAQFAKLETTDDFLQRNIIYNADLRGVFRPWIFNSASTIRAHLRPVVGVETGKNLRSIAPQLDGNGIARLKAGTSFFLIFDLGKPGLQDVTFETNYDRRWPLLNEIRLVRSQSGVTEIFSGTNPRDYVRQTVAIGLTKFVAINVAYEYGSLPPVYQFVDNKFTFGISLRAAFPK